MSVSPPETTKHRRGSWISCVAALGFLLVGATAAPKSEPDDAQDDWVARILEPLPGTRVIGRQRVIDRSVAAVRALGTAPYPSHFARFVREQALMAHRDANGREDHRLGYKATDREVFMQAEPYLRLPQPLASQEFLRAMASPSGYAKAKSLIEAANADLPQERRMTVALFRSQFIRSVDRTTYGRMLVIVPDQPLPDGSRLDQWVQFAIATPDLSPVPLVRSVSVVAIVRPTSGPARAYLMDFYRMVDRSGAIQLVPTVMLPENPSKNCFDCHKTAVIPIHPEAMYALDGRGVLQEVTRDSALLPQVNHRVEGFRGIETPGLDPEDFGPSLGPVGRERSDDFVRSCAEGATLSGASVAKVKSAMRCASCHNEIGPLNFLPALPSDRDQESFKGGRNLVQTYVESGWMPPGNDLTPIERRVLWQCLSRENWDPDTGKGLFVEWLKGR